jgi:hypothetical protein
MSDIETANWSETAASNNAAPPNGMPEGMAPSGVNDAGREIMGAVKREWDRSHPTVTSGGSANAQTLSYSVNPAALVQGQVYSFIAGFTNTGAASLQVGSLGAKAIQLAGSALTGGEIVTGQMVMLAYDGASYQILALPGHLRGGLIGCQVFSTPGSYTYTPTVGTNSVIVELVGGGGGAGGTPATTAGQASMAAPGGGGAYCKSRLTSSFSGASITVGAGGSAASAGANPGGNGGDSIFGSITAGGGQGGAAGSVVSSFPGAPTAASAGGSPSGGNILNIIGGRGGSGLLLSATITLSGEPGNSMLTTGLEGKSAGSPGGAGQAYGGGALPAVAQGSASAQAGGAGGSGIVIVWEFG